MATIAYTFVSRCAGGDHVTLDIAVNGGAAQRVMYSMDDLRQASLANLASLSQEERDALKLQILKAHMIGKTRAQIVSEFQAGGGTVTVTI